MVAEFGAIRFLFTSAAVGHIQSFMAMERKYLHILNTSYKMARKAQILFRISF